VTAAQGFEGPLDTTTKPSPTAGSSSQRGSGGDPLARLTRNPKAMLAVAGVAVAGVAYFSARNTPVADDGGGGSYELDTVETDLYNELQPELETIADRLDDLGKPERRRRKKPPPKKPRKPERDDRPRRPHRGPKGSGPKPRPRPNRPEDDGKGKGNDGRGRGRGKGDGKGKGKGKGNDDGRPRRGPHRPGGPLEPRPDGPPPRRRPNRPGGPLEPRPNGPPKRRAGRRAGGQR